MIRFELQSFKNQRSELLSVWNIHMISSKTCAENVKCRLKQITTDRVFNQNILSRTTPKKSVKIDQKCDILQRKRF